MFRDVADTGDSLVLLLYHSSRSFSTSQLRKRWSGAFIKFSKLSVVQMLYPTSQKRGGSQNWWRRVGKELARRKSFESKASQDLEMLSLAL